MPDLDPGDRPLLLLVDGHSLAFRAFHAFANSRDGGLRTSTGIPTSVCYGFVKALLDVLDAERPASAAVAFDLGEPTFRHEAQADYKAGRPETPEEFFEDLDNLQALLDGLNLSRVVAPGYEADDVLGTLAQRGAAAGFRVKILSGDRDLFQLVNDDRHISVLYMSGGPAAKSSRYVEHRAAQVVDRWGIRPDQVVDFKALCGDKSDNIPGVKGIGEKTAAQLLQTYGTLDGIYGALDALKPGVRAKLAGDREAAYQSQSLAQIVLDVPLAATTDDFRLQGFAADALKPLLEKLEFQQFLRQVDRLQAQLGGPAIGDREGASKSGESGESGGSGESGESGGYEDPDLAFFSPEETDAARAQPTVQRPPDFRPEIVATPEDLADLVAQLDALPPDAPPTAWDTETTALDPLVAELVGIGCCFAVGSDGAADPDGDRPAVRTVYLPLGHADGPNLDRGAALAALKPILEAGDRPKALQNAKFDRAVFQTQGIALAGVVFDPMLASYLLNPDASHNLSDLELRYLGIQAQSYKDLVPKDKTIADLPVEAVADYCGMDVFGTFHLVAPLRRALAAVPELQALFETVELPLEPVLADMERRGIRIDTDYLQALATEIDRDLAAIEKQAYADAGEEFNLGSPKQLSELLFEKLGLDRRKSRKIKTGYSTDAATLEKLKDDHPVVAAIVEHRTLAKLKSTYVEALPALTDRQTGRVHTDFNQTATATGRLSSSNPNLQNIPVRTAFSRQIRRAFLPEPGWQLVSADYSQIELRILAHLSQEEILVEAYREGRDVHRLTAQLLFEKDDPAAVTADERRLGKTINFGVIYGMGASRFAREAGVSRSEAQEFIDRFNARYPKAFDYLQQMQREAIARGYVRTLLGRRRYFNFGSDALKKLRGQDPAAIDLSRIKTRNPYDAQLLRAAANAPIQGSSADIIKVAMVKLHAALQPYQARLLLQVHDELVLEVPPEEWDPVRSTLVGAMESAADLSVPLVVEARAGDNWMEAK